MNGNPAVVYGIGKTQITLYGSSGVPTKRYTLEAEAPEGMALSFPAEGGMHLLGSGAGWARRFALRGYRPTLAIKWDVAVETTVETWTGSTWGTPSSLDTATALTQIINGANLTPALIAPHLDKAFSFPAQPDQGKPWTMTDIHRMAHRGLSLSLIASGLISAIPDWATL